MKRASASCLAFLQVALLSTGLPASAGVNGPQDMSASVDAQAMARAFAAGGVKAADAASVQVMQAREVAAKSLGEDARDLVFVPIAPCTVWDTRFAASAPFTGAIGSGVTRRFYSHLDGAGGNFTAYGGNPSCGEANQTFLGGRPFAAMMIVYVNNPVGSGWLTFYRDGDPDPSNATISVYYSTGPTRTQTVISKSSRGYGTGVYDIAVTGRFSTADASAAVVGYFLKPVNITLPNSVDGTGNILKGANRFIHNYGGANTFIGENAGNFGMSGAGNTGSGWETLVSNTTGSGNTATGAAALNMNTIGNNNTASGTLSLFSNTVGHSNVADGYRALYSNTNGYANVASGASALYSNTTGIENTASGYSALYANLTGFANTATGAYALGNNTTGGRNTAVGGNALSAQSFSNANAPWDADNTAVGFHSLMNNQPTTTGNGVQNSAVGSQSLAANTTGSQNTASGYSALAANSTGTYNTAIGMNSQLNNATGGQNVAVGVSALNVNVSGSANTAVGNIALLNATGSNNVALGFGAGGNLTTGSYNIDLGHAGVAGEGNTIRLGDGNQNRAFIAGIRGIATTNNDAVAVVIDSAGQLGTTSSSRRVKDDVADMDASSSALMRLRPVTFHYKSDTNPSGRRLQYGLIAEEVADVYPGLVAHSADGQVETVMYQFLAPMLLNEYQKLQRTIEGQEMIARKQAKRIAELESDRKLQVARITELEKEASRIAALENQTARMAAALDRLQRAGTVTAGLGLN